VSECRAAVDITNRINAWNGRFQFIVHPNIPALVRSNAGCGQIQAVGIWAAAGGNQQMSSLPFPAYTLQLDFEANTFASYFCGLSYRLQQNLDSILLENGRNLVRNI
jgi:hypothetical protein